jgi:uncharacterized protein YdhG (YjbR/CyaY superfamily)
MLGVSSPNPTPSETFGWPPSATLPRMSLVSGNGPQRVSHAMSAQQVDDYLHRLEEPKRGTLEELRRTILIVIPEAEELISYRVPAFRMHGQVIAGFAAFKNHLSYLPFSGSVLDQIADDLEGYKRTKSSLHFPIDRPLPKALVKRLITVRIADAGLPPL